LSSSFIKSPIPKKLSNSGIFFNKK
jgi:hypothetical protein